MKLLILVVLIINFIILCMCKIASKYSDYEK